MTWENRYPKGHGSGASVRRYLRKGRRRAAFRASLDGPRGRDEWLAVLAPPEPRRGDVQLNGVATDKHWVALRGGVLVTWAEYHALRHRAAELSGTVPEWLP